MNHDFPVLKLSPRLIFFIWKLGHLIHVVKENTNIVPCSMLIFWGVNRTGNEFWTSSPIKTVIFRSFIFDMTETCSLKTQFEFRVASAWNKLIWNLYLMFRGQDVNRSPTRFSKLRGLTKLSFRLYSGFKKVFRLFDT